MRKLIFAICLAFSNIGCAAVLLGGAATAAVFYLSGELKSAEVVNINQAYRSAQSALEQLDFNIIEKEKNNDSAKIIAKIVKDNAKGEKVIIGLKKESNKITKISIRVGKLGDEALSRLILYKMREEFEREVKE